MDDSLKFYSKAIEINPLNAIYYFNRGLNFYKSNKYDFANKDL
jgi:tetratricopeptide (TPR) repeat protein